MRAQKPQFLVGILAREEMLGGIEISPHPEHLMRPLAALAVEDLDFADAGFRENRLELDDLAADPVERIDDGHLLFGGGGGDAVTQHRQSKLPQLLAFVDHMSADANAVGSAPASPICAVAKAS